MVRGLVLDAIEEAASRIGLGYINLAGGGCDVQDLVDGTDRRFRVLKAVRDSETGQYEIVCSSDSVLTITDAEPDSMYRHERWVLAYTVDDAGMIVDIFASPVLGVTGDSVPRLRLGSITALGFAFTPPGPGGGFQPAEEDDLDGLGDAADDEVESGLAI